MTQPSCCSRFVALLFCAVAGTAAAADDLQLARSYGPLLGRRAPPPLEGPGLLLTDIHVDEDWPAGSDYTVEFSPAGGGAAQRFPMLVGQPGALTLQSGRYCLTAVERGGKRYASACEAPFFDVSAHSVDVTGQVDVALRRKRAEVTARRFGPDYAEVPLSEAQQSDVAAHLEASATKGVRTFFVSSPPGLWRIARLFPDGVVEIQQQALANASYERGSWTADGAALVLSFHKGNSLYRFAPDGDGWQGTSTVLTQSDFSGADFATVRYLAVATRLPCWHWQRCGTRWPSGVVSNPDYTFVKHLDTLTGRLELEFALVAEHGVAKPQTPRAVASALSPEQTQDVLKNFALTLYSADLASATTQRYRQSIDFIRNGDALEVRLGDLQPLPSNP
ncbi:hypothetical protein ACFJIW_22255 [Tahibacter sp. UC22_41]|uniref:hypothetical protein n=1 Tax=Tahibacter sp. UC22_41 TaxID=3350178 RepID=UPI0036DA449A